MGSNAQELKLEDRSKRSWDGATRPAAGENIEVQRVGCYLTESLFKRVLRRLFPDERKQERHVSPPLVGYLGTARASKPYELGDISLSGFCLLTDERWIPGTEMPITLQMKDVPVEKGRDCFTVQATVVRSGESGVGFSIVLSEEDSKSAHGNPLQVAWVDRAEMGRFLMRLKNQAEGDISPVEQPVPAEESVSGARKTSQLKTAFEGSR